MDNVQAVLVGRPGLAAQEERAMHASLEKARWDRRDPHSSETRVASEYIRSARIAREENRSTKKP